MRKFVFEISYHERLDGVKWLLIFGLFLLLILIFGLKFYWLLICWKQNLTIKAIKSIDYWFLAFFSGIDTDFWPKILLTTDFLDVEFND